MRRLRTSVTLLGLSLVAGCEKTPEVLQDRYYGNSIGEWLAALLMAVGAVVFAKMIYIVLGRGLKRLTARTETKLDDIIIDMIEEPVVVITGVTGIYFGLSTLTLPVFVKAFLTRSVYFVVILTIAWLLNRLLNALIEEYIVPLVEASDGDLDDQLLPIARKGIRFTIWTVGIVVALNNAGYDVGALIAGLGIGGLAFALAAQDTVSNLFGGFTIFTDRPFTINDRVLVAGHDGYVEEIGVRSTRIRTRAGRLVTIPNSKIVNASTVNVTSEPARRVITNLGLTYDTDETRVQRAIDILREIAEADPDIQPNPIIGFDGFGDFALNVHFRYWIKKKTDADIMEVQNRTNLLILQRFNAESLEFAFPTQTLYTQALAAPASPKNPV